MNIRKVGLAVLACAVFAGCGEKSEDALAISVNGEKLMKSALDADVETLIKAQGSKIPSEQQSYARQMFANQVVQGFIVEKILVAKAKAEGYAVSDADRKQREAEFLKATAKMPDAPKSVEDYFKKFPLGEDRARAEFENGILIDKMLKGARAKAAPKDYAAEAKSIIGGIVSNNAAASAVDASALKKINDLKATLDKAPAADLAKTFADLAKANSACPSSQKGGDLGEFTRGQMVKEFDEVAFTMPVGKVSDPVKTQFGYHLLMVTKKVPAVEAKGDVPATPEKVQASHILIKAGKTERVPTEEETVNSLKKREEREFVANFVKSEIAKANIEAAEEYKMFLPPVEKSASK